MVILANVVTTIMVIGRGEKVRVSTSKIKYFMGSKLMTQGALAKTANVSRATINSTLSKGSCSISTVGKLAKALGVEVTDIIEEGE